MLSIHSFLAGAALGTSTNAAVATVVFFAIVAHKWAASFALSLKLNQTSLRLATRLGAFAVFVALFPLGAAFRSLFLVVLGYAVMAVVAIWT